MRSLHPLVSFLILTAPLGLAACSGDSTNPPGTGSLGIVTTTEGLDPDKDGYVVVLDNDTVGTVGANATLYLDTLAVGPVTVSLAGVAPNCFVLAPNERTVQVPAGDTSYSTFGVQCFQVFGAMHLSVEVTGAELDTEFTTVVDGTDTLYHVTSGETYTLPPGTHYIDLLDVANNCQVAPGIRQVFEVPGGGSVAVNYRLDCADLPGAIAVEVVTSGRDLDPDGYELHTGAVTTAVPSNADTVISDLPSDSITVQLLGVAPNCTVVGGGLHPLSSVRVLPADTIPVRLEVVCGAGAALEFDGTQLAQLSHTAMPDMDSTWTVECWFSSAGQSSYGLLVGQWRAFSVATWLNSAGQVGLSYGLFTAQGAQYANTALIGDTNTARWRHVAVTYDRGRMTLYVDGELLRTNTDQGRSTLPNSQYPLVVGAQIREPHDTTAELFAGRVDEVRIWDVVRTAAEIRAWRDALLPAGTPGLIGYWSFDDGAGPVAHDASGHGRDLILGTAPAPDTADPKWVAPGRP